MTTLDNTHNQLSGTKKLLDLLRKVTPETEHDDLISTFEAIADCMLKEVQIQKGDKRYSILEIEFYYCSPEYPQPLNPNKKGQHLKVTYERKAAAGDWFLHQYGIDLCFESDNLTAFGGILIRSIKEEKSEPILGPVSVRKELLSVFSAFKDSATEEEMPRIVDGHTNAEVADPTYRYNIDDKKYFEVKGYFKDREYHDKLRFIVNGFSNMSSNSKYFDESHIGQSPATINKNKQQKN